MPELTLSPPVGSLNSATEKALVEDCRGEDYQENKQPLVRAVLRIRDISVRIWAVLGIRIRNRIRMFLGLSDPDPLFRGKDPDPSLFS
jgi:hypothetical protein